jgi:hypothetical protein
MNLNHKAGERIKMSKNLVELKPCKCNIRGVLQLRRTTKHKYDISIDPYDYPKYLRAFQYCPICGKKLPRRTP